MKFKSALTAAAALTLATAAHAQMGPAVDATIYTAEGEEVATIVTIENGIAVVDTGTYEGSVPVDALGEGPNGPVISVTKAQLNQLFQQQQAQAMAARDAALIANATVLSADNIEVGTVKSIDGDTAIVTLADGEVALQRDQFATNQTGALIVLATEAQLMAALNGEPAPAGNGGDMMDADAE